MKKNTTIRFNKFNFLVGFLKGSLGLLFMIAGGVLCSVTQWSGLGLLAGVSLGVFGCIQFLDGVKDLRDGINIVEVLPVVPEKSTHTTTHRRSNSHSIVYKHHHKHHQPNSMHVIEPISYSDHQRQKNNKKSQHINVGQEKKWYSGIVTFFCTNNKVSEPVIMHRFERENDTFNFSP